MGNVKIHVGRACGHEGRDIEHLGSSLLTLCGSHALFLSLCSGGARGHMPLGTGGVGHQPATEPPLRMLATPQDASHPRPVTMCLHVAASCVERSRLAKQGGLSPHSALFWLGNWPGHFRALGLHL